MFKTLLLILSSVLIAYHSSSLVTTLATCSHTHSVLTVIFPGEPGLAGCPLNSPSPLIPGLCMDRPKFFMSFLTQSHQVFFGHPLCLIPSTSLATCSLPNYRQNHQPYAPHIPPSVSILSQRPSSVCHSWFQPKPTCGPLAPEVLLQYKHKLTSATKLSLLLYQHLLTLTLVMCLNC